MNTAGSGESVLRDGFGRLHNYLRISLTDNCNFRCSYCMPADVFGQDYFAGKQWMTLDEISGIASAFSTLGVNKIRLTGGEPMVRKDFSQIIECLSRLPVELAVSTNGFFLDQHLDILDRCKVHALNISIDSLKKETFHRLTGKDALDMVKSSIHKAVERGFKVKLNTVLIRGINDTELMDFIDWTRMTPIQIRFIEFMPFKHNRWSAEHVFSGSEILDTLKSHPVIKLKDEPNDTASSYRVEGYLGTFALISTMSQPFCSGCNRLRLTADGKLKNCLFGKDEFDLLTPFRKGESILDIIQSGLTAKHAERGGQIAGDFNAVMPETIQNRSMIAIGG